MHQSEILDRIPSELVDMRMTEPRNHVPLLKTSLSKFIGFDSFQFGWLRTFAGLARRPPEAHCWPQAAAGTAG